MSIDSVYEQWEREVVQKAFERAYAEAFESQMKRNLRLLYEARFGPMPSALAATIETTRDIAKLEDWLLLVALRSPEEVAAVLQAGAP